MKRCYSFHMREMASNLLANGFSGDSSMRLPFFSMKEKKLPSSTCSTENHRTIVSNKARRHRTNSAAWEAKHLPMKPQKSNQPGALQLKTRCMSECVKTRCFCVHPLKITGFDAEGLAIYSFAAKITSDFEPFEKADIVLTGRVPSRVPDGSHRRP